VGAKRWYSDELDITIEIDHDKCDAHAKCLSVCPSEVFELVDEKSTAPNIDQCIECCACVEACPANAIIHSTC
jgi:NAD-dependent dihydropyrimidine dehydrogenase PreA subunit